MDYYKVVERICPNADFNSECFKFSEAEARDRKLWRDERPMPTMQEINDIDNSIQTEEALVSYKKSRKEEYEADGLTFDRFVEMIIENDTVGMDDFKARRNAIKLKYPKPV